MRSRGFGALPALPLIGALTGLKALLLAGGVVTGAVVAARARRAAAVAPYVPGPVGPYGNVPVAPPPPPVSFAPDVNPFVAAGGRLATQATLSTSTAIPGAALLASHGVSGLPSVLKRSTPQGTTSIP